MGRRAFLTRMGMLSVHLCSNLDTTQKRHPGPTGRFPALPSAPTPCLKTQSQPITLTLSLKAWSQPLQAAARAAARAEAAAADSLAQEAESAHMGGGAAMSLTGGTLTTAGTATATHCGGSALRSAVR